MVSFGDIFSEVQKQGIYISDKPIDTGLENILKWVQEQKVIVRAIDDHLSHAVKLGSGLKAESVDQELIVVTSLLKKSEERDAALLADIDRVGAELNKVEIENIECTSTLHEIETAIDNMSRYTSSLLILTDWREELIAYFQSEVHKDNLKKSEQAVTILTNALSLKDRLPTLDAFKLGMGRLAKYNEQLKQLELSIKKQNEIIQEKNKLYSRYHDQFETWRRLQGDFVKKYEEFIDMTRNIIDRQNDKNCPVCGKSFDKKNDLMAAFDENIVMLRENNKTKVPGYYSEMIGVQNELKQLKDNYNKLMGEHKKVSKDKEESLSEVEKWKQNIGILKESIITINQLILKPLRDFNDDQMLTPLLKIELEVALNAVKNTRNQIDGFISNIWAGLRLDEFNRIKMDVLHRYNELDETVSGVLIDADSWVKISKAAVDKMANEKSKKNDFLKKIRDNSEKIEKKKNELASLKESLEKTQKGMKEYQVKRLNLAELSKRIGQIKALLKVESGETDLFNRKPTIERLLSMMGTYEESLFNAIKSRQALKQYLEEASNIEQLITYQKSKLTLLIELRDQMKPIVPLDEHIRKEYLKYEANIQELFLKLHQPADYKAIKFGSDSGKFGLRLISKYSNLEKQPTVLSSGQRAALAISILLALNLFGRNVPSIMLMDEPIQQIDDLNSLNFLDVLRWVIEKHDRQIIFSTANSRVAGLVRKKFSYLREDYAELRISRKPSMPTEIKYFDFDENLTSQGMSGMISA